MDGNKKSSLVALGFFVFVVLALVGYLALKIGTVRTSDSITVEAVFDDAQGIVENGSIRIAGIKVGAVGRLVVEGKRARVTLYIDRDIKVRKDVVATIKAKSLLGEKFVELIPQGETADFLASGDTIEHTFIAAELPDLASQIAPLLAKIDPNDVSRMVKVISRILEKNEDDFPKIVESLGRVAVNVDGMLTRNGPKVDRILDAAYGAVNNSGPKIDRLIDTTQLTMDNANNLVGKSGPKIDKFIDGLSQLDIGRINRMIGEADTALKGAPETLGQVKGMIYKMNILLDGFEGLTWMDLKSLARDDGIVVRMMSRSDTDIEQDRENWGAKKKAKPVVSAVLPEPVKE